MPLRSRSGAAGAAPDAPAAAVFGPAPPLAREPGTTMHGQIEDWLAELIGAQRLRPGDRIPPEQELAAWLGVSRMTLRQALDTLARRGLLTRTVGRGGGTFVAERKLDQDLTTLAGFSEQLRRHGMVAGARVLSAVRRPAGPAAAAALGLAEGEPVFAIRRVRLGNQRPIAIEHSMFPAAAFDGLLDCPLDGSLYELLQDRYARQPRQARESLEPVVAGAQESAVLGVPEGAPLLLVERTAYDEAGQPVEFARDLFRGDRTRVVMWTSQLPGVL